MTSIGVMQILRSAWRRVIDDPLPAMGSISAKGDGLAANAKNDAIAAIMADNAELFTQPDGATRDGVMVAWYPPPEVAAMLALPGGEAPEELHLTLFYAGTVADLRDLDIARLIHVADECLHIILGGFGADTDGRIGGLGRFNASASSDDKDVIYAVVDVPVLEMVRHRLCIHMAEYGVAPASKHGFNPHITLAYIEPGADWPITSIPTIPISIGDLMVVVGGRRISMYQMAANAAGDRMVIANGTAGAGIRTETKDGRTYLIAPAVAIVEGVLNNELVLADEFGRFPGAWNGIPLVIDHPEEKGRPISANTPEQPVYGRLFGVYVDDKKLHGEAWFDVVALEGEGKRGKAVLARLRAGEVMELSTAYWRDLETAAGKFNGKSYSAVARNLRPDHLAILPDKVGACSVREGCGVPRANDGGDNPAARKRLSGEDAGSQEDTSVNLEELIETLAANEFCPLAAEELTLLPEDALQRMAQRCEELAANQDEDEAPPPPGGDDALAGMLARLEQIAARVDEIGANLGSSAKEEWDALAAEVAAHSDGLTAQDLNGMNLEALRKLRAAFVPADYSGRGGVFAAHGNAQPVGAPMPVFGRNTA